MKTISSLAAIFVIALFASPAPAGQQVPFNGSWVSNETYDVQFPVMFVHGTASGYATQLGRYTATYEEQVDLLTLSSVGVISVVAANGDVIFATQTGQGDPTPDPDVFSIVEVSTITGGTGRFAGATGTFTIARLAHLSTGDSSGSFSGTISNPGRH
jgi:hypothetical protein